MTADHMSETITMDFYHICAPMLYRSAQEYTMVFITLMTEMVYTFCSVLQTIRAILRAKAIEASPK